MRIAVNTRVLLPDKMEGIGVFTHEVMRRMVIQHPEHEFLFFFDRPYDKRFVYASNVQPIVAGPQARHPFLFYMWFEYTVAQLLKKHKPDVFLSPDGYLSLRSSVTQVPVIHDLNFEYFPAFFSRLNRMYYHYFFPKYAHKAKRIATVSEYSKSDIHRLYGIAPDRIDVVGNGVDELFQPIDEYQKSVVREKYSQGKPFLVFVGGLYLRKNLMNMLRAFDRFKQKTQSDWKFLIAGKSYHETVALHKLHAQLESREDIVFLGRLSDRQEIRLLLAASEALFYVSLFEGFGLPIVEAMRSRTAVITGDCTAMPEIADNAALFANPNDVEQIAKVLQELSENNALRNQLAHNGRQRANLYSWDLVENRLWNSICMATQNP